MSVTLWFMVQFSLLKLLISMPLGCWLFISSYKHISMPYSALFIFYIFYIPKSHRIPKLNNYTLLNIAGTALNKVCIL